MMVKKNKEEVEVVVNENDLIEIVQKPLKGKHNLNTLEDKITLITSKHNKKDYLYNKKRVVNKEFRQQVVKIKCSLCNFTGVSSLFSPVSGKLLCGNCLLSNFGR